MKPIQLELQGFEKTEKPEPMNTNDMARFIYRGIINNMPKLYESIKAAK
jgi:hypothetical protein